MENILNIENLRYVYAKETSSAYEALKGVSIVVEKGQVFGLLGPNGAGKSTLIEVICGSLQPDSGSVEVLGLNPFLQRPLLQKHVGYMHQRFSLYPNLTFRENVLFFGRLYGIPGKELKRKAEAICDTLEIGQNSKLLVSALPLGMKQRLSFAVSRIHDPQLIILDEPTAGVDPWTRKKFWEEIYQSKEKGQTVIVCTHSMDEAFHCDKICMIASGLVRAMAAPLELMKHYDGIPLADIFYKLTNDAR